MSDLVFSAPTVDDAVAEAAHTLGLSRGQVRYVILQEARVAGARTPPQPAKIVVFVGQGTTKAPTSESERVPRTLETTAAALAAALTRAANVEATLAVSEAHDGVSISVRSQGAAPWDEDAEVQEALDLLLRRIASADGQGRRIRILGQGEGQGDRCEAALRQTALSVADAVLADGETRAMEHLNAFERRMVHMVLADLPGIRTRSEGVGSGRRLLIETTHARDV
jgi:predicted RNA-binding protein Jag